MSFDPFDPQRKNGFLIEWRVSPNGEVAQKLGVAQQHLQSLAPNAIQVPQSCAANNCHATLAEFQLPDAKALAIAKQVLTEFAEKRLPVLAAAALADAPAGAPAAASSGSKAAQQQQQKNVNDDDDGEAVSKASSSILSALPKVTIQPALQDFRGNVLFVGGKSKFLEAVYSELYSVLHAAKLIPSPKPQRDLVIHLTIGRVAKTAQGDATLLQGLQADEFWQKNLAGLADAGELVFCSRRYGPEPTPPVIFEMWPRLQK